MASLSDPVQRESNKPPIFVMGVLDYQLFQQSLASLVERLLSFPPEAVAAVKQYLATAPRHSAVGAESYGASLLANVLASR